MPARSSVLLTLADDVRYQLDARIIDAGFGGYAQHAAWLASLGHRISVSALQRYGRTLQREVSPEIYRLRVACARTAMLQATLREHGVELPDVLAVKLQEQLHQAIEDGADAERMGALQRASRTLYATVRSQSSVAEERRAGEAAAAEKAARKGAGQRLSPGGEAAMRAAVEGGAG